MSEKRKVKAEPWSNLKFGAVSCERREKPWEVQHLPVVTLKLKNQAAPYLHQEASKLEQLFNAAISNSWASVQYCHQYPWLGRNLLSCFFYGAVILFSHEFQGTWSACYVRLLGVTWVKCDGALAPPGTHQKSKAHWIKTFPRKSSPF